MSEDMFRTVGRTDGEAANCSQLLAGRRAVHTFLSFASPSKKVTEFVALIEIPSKRKEKKKRVVPDQRESPRIARVSWISKVSCSKGDSSLAAFSVVTSAQRQLSEDAGSVGV